MHLKLYKEKFRDFGETAFRLLFEKGDITTYVWVNEYTVKGFQVNYKEEYFFHWGESGVVRITGISNYPFLRSISEELGDEQKSVAIKVVGNLSCPGYKSLFDQVRRIAGGEKIYKILLSEKEFAAVQSLSTVDCAASH